MDYFLTYLVMIAGDVKGIFHVLEGAGIVCGILLLIGLAIYTGMMSIEAEEFVWSNEKYKETNRFMGRIGKIIVGVTAASLILSAIIPSSKQIAVIYLLPKLANNEQIKEIPNNMAELANEGLKELIGELKQETKQAVNGE